MVGATKRRRAGGLSASPYARPSGYWNTDIAAALERVADLLATQEGNPFRVRAYANAAQTLRVLGQPVQILLKDGGIEALQALPGIGQGIAGTIERLLRTGRFPLLDRLEGEVCPEALFTTVPGIGDQLAERIHEVLDIGTLEELEVAAHDGRLDHVPGFGPRRVRAVREALGSMLGRASRRRALSGEVHRHASTRVGKTAQGAPASLPSATDLLAVDREYRELAEKDALVRIAPRRFNPEGKRWLPVFHTTLGDWEATALYSNTAQAHRLGRTGDWVVIYVELDDRTERFTVVTQRTGPMKGLRVVRGRELECSEYYQRVGTWSAPEEPEPVEAEPFFPGFEDTGDSGPP